MDMIHFKFTGVCGYILMFIVSVKFKGERIYIFNLRDITLVSIFITSVNVLNTSANILNTTINRLNASVQVL